MSALSSRVIADFPQKYRFLHFDFFAAACLRRFAHKAFIRADWAFLAAADIPRPRPFVVMAGEVDGIITATAAFPGRPRRLAEP